MKPFTRKLAVLLILVLVVAVIKLPFDRFYRMVFSHIQSAAQDQGIGVLAEQISFKFPVTLHTTGLSIYTRIGETPIPFYFNTFDASLKLLPIALFRRVLAGSGTAYDGSLELLVAGSLFGDPDEVTLTISNFDISQHPAARIYSLAGSLSAELKTHFQKSLTGMPKDTAASISLSNGSFPSGVKLFGLIEIPAVKEINIASKFNQQLEKIMIQGLRVSCSLGTAQAKGSLQLTKDGEISTAALDAVLELSQEGQTSVGQWLALQAGQSIEAPAANWSIEARKNSGQDWQVVVLPRS